MNENYAPERGIDLRYYVAMISRRRWVIILPFCLAMLVGIVLAIKLPKLYEASTLILVQRQRVPENLVQPVVTSDIEYRISTISQQIMSRSNLEKVIERFKLFPGADSRGVFMEDKIADLRKRINVEVSRSKRDRDADAFTISFQDSDPQMTMRVANGLATFFIDENLKVRETQAVGTTDFLESELESTRVRLEQLEKELKEYRLKMMGELPEQLETNLRILDRLNAQVAEKEQSLRSARTSLAALEGETSARQSVMAAAASGAGAKEGDDALSLSQLKERLASLQSSYTDQHPDVMRLKTRIEKLEAEMAANPAAARGAAGASPAQMARAESMRQKMLLEGAIRNLEIDIGRIHQEIREYQRRVDAAPKREQELLTLKRDYDNIKASYNSLLNRKLEADIAVNMEKKQKGEQFQILDMARVPQRPVSPDLRKLFLIVLLAGLGLGGGAVFILEFLDSSLRRPRDFEDHLGLPVLAAVPWIESPKDIFRRGLNRALSAVSVLFALALTGVMVWMVVNGVEPALELIRQYNRV